MEKSCLEKDLDGWEFLPDDKSFLDLSHDSKIDVLFKEIIVDTNYFICPSHPLIEQKENSSSSKEVVPPLRSESTAEKKSDEAGDKEFKDIGVVSPVILANHVHDVVSQVFFKNFKENEFVDMKIMDSPKSNTMAAIMPHVEPEHVEFIEDKEESLDHIPMENSPLEEEEMGKEKDQDQDHAGSEIKGKACGDGFGFTIWNWRLTGIGAFCSMGAAAAATVCIFVFGGRQHQKQQQKHKIQFKFYRDDKRMKEVLQQATRLNQALSAMRGAPATRARISFGGYYN